VSLMPMALSVIASEQPGVKVSLMEGLRTEMLRLVEDGTVAFGIGPYTDVPDALSFRPLFGQEFRLILPEKHPIARRGYATAEDLRTLDMMCPSAGSTARQVLDDLTLSAGFKVVPRYETLQYPTLFALVSAGLGATVMPVVDPTLLSASRLVALPFAGEVVKRTIGVISRRGEVETPTSTLVIQILLKMALMNKARLGILL
jgi:LysR family carnitine catabolism transcriptional activator